ncbi:hypothetical protein [Streptomyces wuyuanensis]|uniref:hypothetical protein n=1 Tax=Streptomyces wuyuanensis TaxID=1196353 RepID=UPI00369C7437
MKRSVRKAAREQTLPSWAKLRDQLGSALPRMRHAEQVEVLYLADRDTPADEPMLSTVLAVSDPSVLPAFRQAATRLGLELPDDPQDLRDVLDADLERLHTLWRLR